MCLLIECLSFPVPVYKNCAEVYKSGERFSGVYTIDPDGSGAFDVFCDQTTAGGGWTVFQKRLDGSVDFYRGWNDYKRGFGNLNGEFWLGLDKIHRLTKALKNRLRVDLEDTTGKTAYAEYNMFAVTGESAKYRLSIGTYSGKYRYVRARYQFNKVRDVRHTRGVHLCVLLVHQQTTLYIHGLYS